MKVFPSSHIFRNVVSSKICGWTTDRTWGKQTASKFWRSYGCPQLTELRPPFAPWLSVLLPWQPNQMYNLARPWHTNTHEEMFFSYNNRHGCGLGSFSSQKLRKMVKNRLFFAWKSDILGFQKKYSLISRKPQSCLVITSFTCNL